jgi:hypothetical protein
MWRSARNKANAGERMTPRTEIYNLVHYYLAEFENLCKEKSLSSAPNRPSWRPPPLEYYKINVDASFYPDTGRGGWGFVARDCDGNFLEGEQGLLPNMQAFQPRSRA